MRHLYRAIACLSILIMFISPALGGEEITTENSALIVEASLSTHELESRRSAVRVETESGYGSGTYVLISRRRVVITAAHVIKDHSTVIIHGSEGEKVRGDVIYVDSDNDFAIVKLPTLKTRRAVRFRPAGSEPNDFIGQNIFYSGYPKGHELLTIRGSVAGVERGFLLLQSYAWMGASGAGVFNSLGEFVGVLVAVDVGFFDGSAHIVESIVWIIPIRNIETRLIRRVIVQKIPL